MQCIVLQKWTFFLVLAHCVMPPARDLDFVEKTHDQSMSSDWLLRNFCVENTLVLSG